GSAAGYRYGHGTPRVDDGLECRRTQDRLALPGSRAAKPGRKSGSGPAAGFRPHRGRHSHPFVERRFHRCCERRPGMSPDRSRDSLINTFVGNLEWLAHPDREDRAALARLRRCAGRTIAESREVLDLFYSLFVPKGRSSAPEVELPELRP